MNIGQQIAEWGLQQIQWLVLLILAAIALPQLIRKNFAALAMYAFVGAVVIIFTYYPEEFKDLVGKIFTAIFNI